MKTLLNTLYVTLPDSYLSINGENILVRQSEETIARFPLHNLESVVTFSNIGVSPKLIEKCVDNNISVAFLTPNGRYRGRILGPSNGNVILRKKQYELSADPDKSVEIANNFILGKLFNQKWQLERYIRDYPLRVNTEILKSYSEELSKYLKLVRSCESLPTLRGYEGTAQVFYFQGFNEMILNQKEDFYFESRSRRPPLDRVNCLLSFFYTLLANDTAAALETVGLDAYVGFLHTDRPGRTSLALDMIEELRCICVDRFVLSLINKKQINATDFIEEQNGAVTIKEDTRKELFKLWQNRKQELLTHPFLKEKIEWGLVPYVQAMLMARFIRGDLEEYVPLLWK